MNARDRLNGSVTMTARGAVVLAVALLVCLMSSPAARATCDHCGSFWHRHCANGLRYNSGPGDIRNLEEGGTWYWMRSPEQEKRVVMNLFNRYCIRCHGVDGRGIWDIPDVPDFANIRWQASRPEAYRTRVILEGRGAVMPSFRGTITIEEACALARYLNTFLPGTEVSRPDVRPTAEAPANKPAASTAPATTPPPVAPATARTGILQPVPPPTPGSRGAFSPTRSAETPK